jgi:hypothetical protein
LFGFTYSTRWSGTCKEICSRTWRSYSRAYKIAGITREQIWIQRSPPGSGAPDLEIASIETGDLANTFKEFATSNHPWAVRFRDYAKKAHGMRCSICQKYLGTLIIKTELQYQVISELLGLADAQPICPKCMDNTIKSNLR